MKPLFERQGAFSVSKDGYRLDRRLLFGWAMLIIIVVTMSGSWLLKNGGFFISCPGDRPCENPYYQDERLCSKMTTVTRGEYSWLCDQELLLPGEEYGKRLPFYAENIVPLFFLSLIMVLLLNHYVHNKDKTMFEEE